MNRTIVVMLLTAMFFTPALADTITINRMPYSGVTVTNVKNEWVLFTVDRTGAKLSKRLSEITLIQLSQNASFSRAETMRLEKRYDKATEEYHTAAEQAEEQWIRDLVVYRLANLKQSARVTKSEKTTKPTRKRNLKGWQTDPGKLLDRIKDPPKHPREEDEDFDDWPQTKQRPFIIRYERGLRTWNNSLNRYNSTATWQLAVMSWKKAKEDIRPRNTAVRTVVPRTHARPGHARGGYVRPRLRPNQTPRETTRTVYILKAWSPDGVLVEITFRKTSYWPFVKALKAYDGIKVTGVIGSVKLVPEVPKIKDTTKASPARPTPGHPGMMPNMPGMRPSHRPTGSTTKLPITDSLTTNPLAGRRHIVVTMRARSVERHKSPVRKPKPPSAKTENTAKTETGAAGLIAKLLGIKNAGPSAIGEASIYGQNITAKNVVFSLDVSKGMKPQLADAKANIKEAINALSPQQNFALVCVRAAVGHPGMMPSGMPGMPGMKSQLKPASPQAKAAAIRTLDATTASGKSPGYNLVTQAMNPMMYTRIKPGTNALYLITNSQLTFDAGTLAMLSNPDIRATLAKQGQAARTLMIAILYGNEQTATTKALEALVTQSGGKVVRLKADGTKTQARPASQIKGGVKMLGKHMDADSIVFIVDRSESMKPILKDAEQAILLAVKSMRQDQYFRVMVMPPSTGMLGRTQPMNGYDAILFPKAAGKTAKKATPATPGHPGMMMRPGGGVVNVLPATRENKAALAAQLKLSTEETKTFDNLMYPAQRSSRTAKNKGKRVVCMITNGSYRFDRNSFKTSSAHGNPLMEVHVYAFIMGKSDRQSQQALAAATKNNKGELFVIENPAEVLEGLKSGGVKMTSPADFAKPIPANLKFAAEKAFAKGKTYFIWQTTKKKEPFMGSYWMTYQFGYAVNPDRDPVHFKTSINVKALHTKTHKWAAITRISNAKSIKKTGKKKAYVWRANAEFDPNEAMLKGRAKCKVTLVDTEKGKPVSNEVVFWSQLD